MIKDKKQLCNEILGIKERTLKQLELNDKLEERLNTKGYKLINKYKEGRKVYYELEQQSELKEIYSNLVSTVYRSRKEEEFTKYFQLRTSPNDKLPLNKADIGDKSNVSIWTVSKWDNILLDKGIISKDGFHYFCFNKDKLIIKQCSEEEYKGYWKNRAIERNIEKLEKLYMSGERGFKDVLRANSDFTTKVNMMDNKYYFRIKKFRTNEDNQLYIDTLNLQIAIYGNEEDFKPNFEIIEAKDIKFIPIINFKKIQKNKYKITKKLTK